MTQPYNTTKQTPFILNVKVKHCRIVVDSSIGKTTTYDFYNGLLRIYRDVPRLEFKQHGGEYDGQVVGVPFELVRYYSYLPVPCEQFNVEL